MFTQPTPVLSLGSDLLSRSLSSQPPPFPGGEQQASQAGEFWSAPIICAGISPLYPLHPCCCTFLHGSEASPLPPSTTISASEGASYFVETFPSSKLPPTGAGPIPILLSLFFLFSFALPRYMGSLLPFGRSEVFCQHSVGVL